MKRLKTINERRRFFKKKPKEVSLRFYFLESEILAFENLVKVFKSKKIPKFGCDGNNATSDKMFFINSDDMKEYLSLQMLRILENRPEEYLDSPKNYMEIDGEKIYLNKRVDD